MKIKANNSWAKTPRGKFSTHRCNAAKRSIPFKLTYEEWLLVWGDKLPLRGPRRGQLVMSRKDDRGPYKIGNVEIVTSSQNIKNQISNVSAQVNLVKRVLIKIDAEENLNAYFS